jgi:hypothetical protein
MVDEVSPSPKFHKYLVAFVVRLKNLTLEPRQESVSDLKSSTAPPVLMKFGFMTVSFAPVESVIIKVTVNNAAVV